MDEHQLMITGTGDGDDQDPSNVGIGGDYGERVASVIRMTMVAIVLGER